MKKLIIKHSQDILIFLLIAGISLAHYLTNSESNSFHSFIRLLYLIPIILGGFRHGFKGAIFLAFLVGLIYSPHMLLSVWLGSSTKNELLDILLFFAVGIIVGILSEKKSLRGIQLEEELKKHIILEQYTNSIIQSIKSGVIVINKDLFITIINQGAIEILGTDEDCVDKNFMEVFHCCTDIKQEILNAINDCRSIENIEIQLDEKHKDVNISIYPLNQNSINKGLVIIIEDISELKKLQSQALRNEKLVALGELSSGIAHEIRNPLAIIKAIEQTMKSELKHNKEALKELDIIDEEVERANKIVKALMEFAKPNKSNIQFYIIKDIVDEVLLIVHKYAIQKNIQIEVAKVEPVQIMADKEQLKQAFINIIFNAVEAMPTGGTIKVSSSIENDKWVRLIFEDNGVGIEEGNLIKIFNPFFTTKEQGTGLGLSIVHRILEDHGCIINVISNVDRGTKFEIMFPIKREGANFNEKSINS